MNRAVHVLLVGAAGRMGKEICLSAERSQGTNFPVKILGGIVSPNCPTLAQSQSGILYPLSADWIPEYKDVDVIVDFSSNDGAQIALRLAEDRSLPILVASTGLAAETVEWAERLSNLVPVLLTSNTSLVVTVARRLVREAGQMLNSGFDVELVELHHRHKKDAPSGTALSLLEEVARGQGKKLSEVLDLGRQGNEATRTPGSYGAQAVRGGDIAGEHTVYFIGDGERLEITQRASSRKVFADGALRAAVWLADQARKYPGYFSMEDVLVKGSS